MPLNPKHRSSTITDGRERAGARAMLKGIGFTDEDLKRPIIGVANTWTETMPCNFHLRRLAVKVKEGIRAAGGSDARSGMGRTLALFCRRGRGDAADSCR